MALSIRNTVCQINEALAKVFIGSTLYGVATLVAKEGKAAPQVDDKPVSYDDSYSLQIYHRVNTVNLTYSGGFGRNVDTTNTFAMIAIVFNNEKKTKLKTDEIAMIMQSYLANINISATITPTSIILNSAAVFATEYRGHEFKLPEDMSLFQFNYNVAITFKSGCFDLCPEDFSQCKIN